MAKAKIICDSDVMIDYWKIANERHATTKGIIETQIGIENVVLSSVTQMELIVGAINEADLNKINKNIDSLILATINEKIITKACGLLQKYKLSHNLGFADSIIAATAIITELELFTYNVKDYKFISELKLFSL